MLRIPSAETARSIVDFLIASEYTEASLASGLGLENGLHANLDNMPGLLRKTAGESLLPVLARLFFVGLPQPVDLWRSLIPAQVRDDLESIGLVQTSPAEVLPQALLIPNEKIYLAADTVPQRKNNPRMVMGASASTRLLSQFLVPVDADSCLDVGCGNGALTFHVSHFCRHVTGIDINDRSIEFAKFNAAFNGIAHVEFLTGDTFGPVQGRKFSRIVCNPPFLIGPSPVSAYCDSPLELDGFARYLALEAPAYLEEGGYFQMLCEWVRIKGHAWQDRLREWTENSGCDVLIVTGTKLHPADYSERRHSEAKQMHGHEAEETLLGRLDYFDQNQVELIQGGVINMRKRSGKNWFSIIETAMSPLTVGKAIHDRFETLSFLALHPAEQLLGTKLRLSETTELEQRSRLGANGLEVQGCRLTLSSGLQDSLRLDEVVSKFIPLFDGTRSVDEIACSVSGSLEWPLEDARNRCVALAARLLQGSFVKPV